MYNKNINDTSFYKDIPKEFSDYIKKTLLNSNRIDKKSKYFEKLLFDMKQFNIDSNLINIIKSKKIILLLPDNPLIPDLKIMCLKDIIDIKSKENKIFIDLSNVIRIKDSYYNIIKPDWLRNYLIGAILWGIFNMKPTLLFNNIKLQNLLFISYSKLISYIIDRMIKISFDSTMKLKLKILLKKNDFIDFKSFFNIYLNKLKFKLNLNKFKKLFFSSFYTQISLELLPTYLYLLTSTFYGGYSNPKQVLIENVIEEQNLININDILNNIMKKVS